MNPARTAEQAEVVARRILSWMAQVQRDRSLPVSALGTAFDLVKGLVDGVEGVEVARLRATLGPHGSSLDRDLQALVRGRHLMLSFDSNGTARPIMRFRHNSRRGVRT